MNGISQYISFKNLVYFFSLIAGWPCVFFLLGWLPGYQFNYLLLFGVCLLMYLFKGDRNVYLEISKLILIQIIGWIAYSVIHFDSSYYTRILLLLITYFIICFQQNDNEPKSFLKIYNGWILLQAICGTIGVILVIVGVLTPLFSFMELDHRPGYFFGLFTTNTYLGGLVRNAGFFDEPGAMAFWGIYALILNKLFVKNPLVEKLLIFGLISTLSLAYFIQLALYLLVFYRQKSWKLILLAFTIFIVMKWFASFNDSLNRAIFGRFEYDSQSGTLSGDNRSDLLDACWRIFLQYPIFGVGARILASPEIAGEYGFVGANFFTNFASDGLIGAIITYLPLIYLIRLGFSNKKLLGVCGILLLGFLQRPYDNTQLLYPLLNYTLLFWAITTHEEDFEEADDGIDEIYVRPSDKRS